MFTIIICSLVLILVVISQNIKDVIIISPFPLKAENISENDGKSIKYCFAKEANLIFLAAGYEGIFVIDSKTNDILNQKRFYLPNSKNRIFINGFDVTPDGNYLLIPYLNKFTIIKFTKQNYQYDIISQQEFPGGKIMNVVLHQNLQIAFGMGLDGAFNTYNIKDKMNPQIICKYSTGSLYVRNVIISKKNNYLFLSDDFKGVTILEYDYKSEVNSMEMKLITQRYPEWQVIDIAITKKEDYLFTLETWYGVFITDLTKALSEKKIEFPHVYWPYTNYGVFKILLVQNDNYMLIGQRAVGMRIVDIKNKTNPIHYQQIKCIGDSIHLFMTDEEKFLYYANGSEIMIYEVNTPNLNDNFPNFFNGFQSNMTSFSKSIQYWRCDVGKNDKYLYSACDDDGFYILDINKNPYNMKVATHIFIGNKFNSDSAAYSEDENILYIGVSSDKEALWVIDMHDKYNTTVIDTLKYNGIADSDTVFFSKDRNLMCTGNGSGVLLIDTTDKKKLKLISEFLITSEMLGTVEDCMITDDNNFIIATVRGFGLFVLDITKRNKMELKFQLQTFGAEGILNSKDPNYAYLIDGYLGLAILDISNLPNVSILSRVRLEGWMQSALTLQDEKYLVAVTMQEGQLALIDIQDKTKPFVLSKYANANENTWNACATSDEEYIFIQTYLGIRIFPLKSKVYIHTDIIEVTGEQQGERHQTKLSPSEKLKVGQIIEFNFMLLYPTKGMEIQQILYLENQELKQIPHYMKFTKSTSNLRMEITKEALGEKASQEGSLNTIVLQTVVPVNENMFVYNDEIVTTPEQSKMIHKYFKTLHIINNQNQVTDLFDPNDIMEFQIEGIKPSKRLFDLVKLTLMRGVYFNPVLFYIQPSLQLDYKNLTQTIITTSSSIILYLSVNQIEGKFVKKDYKGVIASTTDQQNEIKIEGSIENVNKVLKEKITFAATNKYYTFFQVQLTVIDGINYDYKDSKSSTDLLFISFNEDVKKKSLNILQEQVNKLYPNGELEIETQINIDFQKDSFIDEDINSLTFSAQLQIDGIFQDYPSSFWLQFNSRELKFQGKATAEELYSIINIQIIASDGYSQDSCKFQLKVNKVPFLYILNYALKVLGPIFAGLGIFKYKSFILNLFTKQRTYYTDEIVIINQKYQKQITILGKELKKGRILFKAFQQKLLGNNPHFHKEFKEKKKFMNITSVNSMREKTNTLGTGREKRATIGSKRKDLTPKNLPQENPQTTEIQQLQISQNETKQLKLRKLKKYEEQTNLQLIQSVLQRLNQLEDYKPQNVIEQNCLKKDGSVAMGNLIRDMLLFDLNYSFSGKKYNIKQDTNDLTNKDSRLYMCIKGLLVRYLIQQDNKTNLVYSYLKFYAQTHYQFTLNDWYKAFVEIIPTQRLDKYSQQVPFPDLAIKEKAMNLALMELGLHTYLEEKLETLQQKKINHFLIVESLFFDALGIVDYQPSQLQPCIGESIHLQFYEVSSVEAFKEIKNSWCMGLRRLIGMDYMNFGVSKNYSLPYWISFNQTNGVIFLQGIPSASDCDNLLIRIYNDDGYIIKQYKFIIVDEYSDQQQQVLEPDNITMSDNNNYALGSSNVIKKNDNKYEENNSNNNNFKATKSIFYKEQQITFSDVPIIKQDTRQSDMLLFSIKKKTKEIEDFPKENDNQDNQQQYKNQQANNIQQENTQYENQESKTKSPENAQNFQSNPNFNISQTVFVQKSGININDNNISTLIEAQQSQRKVDESILIQNTNNMN